MINIKSTVTFLNKRTEKFISFLRNSKEPIVNKHNLPESLIGGLRKKKMQIFFFKGVYKWEDKRNADIRFLSSDFYLFIKIRWMRSDRLDQVPHMLHTKEILWKASTFLLFYLLIILNFYHHVLFFKWMHHKWKVLRYYFIIQHLKAYVIF